MRIIVVYDITEDKLRSRVAEILKNFGLKRIQLSAFYGSISYHKSQKLKEKLNKLLKKDVCHIIYLCERCDKAIEQIGFAFKPVEEDLVIF